MCNPIKPSGVGYSGINILHIRVFSPLKQISGRPGAGTNHRISISVVLIHLVHTKIPQTCITHIYTYKKLASLCLHMNGSAEGGLLIREYQLLNTYKALDIKTHIICIWTVTAFHYMKHQNDLTE
jgi:hypothetical protein